MEDTTAIAAFSSVLASTVELAEKGFEICAIDEQAKSLLNTVQQVAGQLDDARALRRQKSALFNSFEKRMFDDTFKHVEDAICHVAALAERSRADMEVSNGKLKVNSRVLYVLRDSPNIQVSLSQLGIASQGLNSTLVQLSSRGIRRASSASAQSGPPQNSPPQNSPPRNSPPRNSRPQNSPPQSSPPQSRPEPRPRLMKPPPTYEESQFFSEGRRRNMQRRASALALGEPSVQERSRSHSTLSLPARPVQAIPELDIPELAADSCYRPISLPSFSPDLSIPEVWLQDERASLAVEPPRPSPSPQPEKHNEMPEKPNSSSTPLSRRVQPGRRTGKARMQSWLEARALQ